MEQAIQIHRQDNVAVALQALPAGQTVRVGGQDTTPAQDIPRGHKMALCPIAAGGAVVKYGRPIGLATADIAPGEWVHTHNLKTALGQQGHYRYQPAGAPLVPRESASFMGYLRGDGKAGVRNEVWVLPTVGCVNDVCTRLALENAALAQEFGLDGVYAFPHPYGCSQMGEDHAATRRVLAALACHPNAGAVLVVGLGCENNTMEGFQEELGEFEPGRVQFMVCQNVEDELQAGRELLRQLAAFAGKAKRQPLPASKLVVGMKCGGSDGLSGITANALVGAFSDRLVAMGGSTILTEVPEMFGAEEALLNRCASEAVFQKAVAMVEDFKHYFTSHGQVVYENPSPGNKQGGITTLEDKSLGCVQKGGFAPVADVIAYGEAATTPGLTLLSGPGNDLVSTTALTAAGAQVILFTTGRGTPFGAPAPTLKIASNTALAQSKANWVDFDAGAMAEGSPLEAEAEALLQLVLQTAGGEYRTKAEQAGYRNIAIFKNGVTL